MTEREIFFEALEMATPEARAAYLQGACGPDVTLRRKVEELLVEHFSNDSLLAGSALEADRISETRLPASESPAQIIGRYKLLERIGEGGFGEVWMAEQREPVKRRVALKIIKLGMDSRQVVARFEAERQALAMMDHPNIAKIFDADVTDNGKPYFVMELVRGIKITEYCDQNQLPIRERLNLFILVCQAIQHAHQKGIIHRDIKPSNVLVTLHDGVPVPKVIDFGIAKTTQQELTDKTVFTQIQQFIGTPAYISPEQAEMSGLDVDTRADIYSLGVLLYELLVGQTPFDAKEMMKGGLDAIRKTIREKEPVRPSTRLTQIPGADIRRLTAKSAVRNPRTLIPSDLDWIVMKCLEKDRTRRYETASGLAADIGRHIDNEPVVARPPSAAYRFQKAFRRNKLLFAAGTAVVVTLVLGVMGTTIGLLRAEKQRQAAEQKQTEAEAERQRAQTEQQRANAQALKASASERQSRRLNYGSDMNLAQQAMKVNNLGRARFLLDRHRPLQPAGEDLRGWEWRYLWQLTRGNEDAVLTNRPTPGFSLSFSPDGKRLAVGWWDGRVELWDVPARRWVRALTGGELPHPARVVFSPVGNVLAATSGPSAVSLYDFDSGRESILWQMTDDGGWDIRDLVFSQDGSRLVIFTGSNPAAEDAVWVVNVSSSRIESRHPTGRSLKGWPHIGAARLSPDNRRLYRVDSFEWNGRVECIDLGTSEERWKTESQGEPIMSMDISPDGRVLASASGFTTTTIQIWDTATGGLLKKLPGHTASVIDLAFTRDGRRLISAAEDQTIRFWDTSTWTETQVLRGHTDEVWAIAISEAAQRIATTGKDGRLMLWRMDEKRAAYGYRRLLEGWEDDVQPLDHSRVLLLSPGRAPELLDLKGDFPPVALSRIGSSEDILGCFGTNLLCVWNGTNQLLVGDLDGTEFVQRAAIPLNSGVRPTGLACNPERRLLAWSEKTSSSAIYLASLGKSNWAAGRRIEVTNDVPGLVPFRFSEDGKYLAAAKEPDTLRVWNVDSGQIVVSINENVSRTWPTAPFSISSCFAANGVLVVTIPRRIRNELAFYNLARPDQPPRLVAGGFEEQRLAVSPNGELVAACSKEGQVLLFNAAKGELIDSFRGHLVTVMSSAFSPDGRRVFSTDWGREAVKLWDVATRQELLTLAGADQYLPNARWSADGNVILAGPPWQAWSAPSWEEIEAAEAKEKSESRQP